MWHRQLRRCRASLTGWRKLQYRSHAPSKEETTAMTTRRTYADVESFITMLRVACDDLTLRETLQHLLEQPDQTRKTILYALVEQLRASKAPADFVDAFVCLLDDKVAERAYQVIYQCAEKAR
jgi:hypothetical protein